jgi:hypothetical protein
MSFQIIEILEEQPETILARVKHENNPLTAVLSSPKVDTLTVGNTFSAEIDYDRILHWKTIPDFQDTQSAIWQEEDGIHLAGRIHNILDYGDGRTIIDVYLENGAEFFSVKSDMIDDELLANDTGLEITVGNLYLYPYDD